LNKPHFSKSYSRYAMILLILVNLLNYIDRQVLFAMFPLIKDDLSLSDTALGFLGSAFMISYICTAPFFGWFGDRFSRVHLAAGGVAAWSLATAMAGFSTGYRTLIAARAAVGIGEASFGTVSPGLVSDFFPKEERGRVLSRFYVAIPVGSAIGYLLGGILGKIYGWHSAFFIVGLPGMILALMLFFLKEPQRGGESQDTDEETETVSVDRSYRSLARNHSFLMNTLAMTAMTFAMGGLAQWFPSFLHRAHSLDIAEGNMLFGGVTVVAGIAGTMAGGWLGDYWQKRKKGGYLVVSGAGFFIGAPIAMFAMLAPSPFWCMTATFFAEFFLFLNTGPLNTVIINVTKPEIRAMAFAVNIFFIHALGDAISPSIIGWFSDAWGLRTALLLTPLAMMAAGVFCMICTRHIAADMTEAGQ